MSDQVKRISECYVRPKVEINDSQRQYNLNSSDISMLLFSYIQWIYLFKKPQNFSSSSFLANLKLSLSQTLVHFYPLAGQFVTQRYKHEDHSCSIYIDCHKGLGAKLIHAKAVNLIIDDVLSPNTDIPDIVQSFFDIDTRNSINCNGHTKPLVSVQVTELADGVTIGICINHSVVDGTSCLNFLKTWSEIFMASSSINMPVIDGNGTMIKLPYFDSDELINGVHHSNTRERIFHFSPSSIAMLKAKANAEASVTSGSISSHQAMSALVWRCFTRARTLCANAKTTCWLVANLRPRFDPPLSQDYFGNFLMPAKETAEVGELLGHSLGWAAMLLHRAVVGLGNRVSQGVFCERVTQLLLPRLQSLGDNPVMVAGSSRFDVYGVAFGLGRAVAVHRGFQNKDRFVSAFPGAKGDGSVDLQASLESQTMGLLLSDEEWMSFASS